MNLPVSHITPPDYLNSVIKPMAVVEKAHIESSLIQCNYNVHRCARALKMHRTTLANKIHTYKINNPRSQR